MQIPHNQTDNSMLEDSISSQTLEATSIPEDTSRNIQDKSNIQQKNLRSPKQPKGFSKYPVIFLTGIWLVLMVLGWLSMTEIISPGTNAPLPKTPIAEAQREKNSSLGVLGAIAASCAVVSVLLAQKMEQRR